MTENERQSARIARHFASLTELASRLPRSIDDVVKLHPASREQMGWIALDIGKTLRYAPGATPGLEKAGETLRLYALSLLGERCGTPLASADCPLSARLAQLEAIIKEREAA